MLRTLLVALALTSLLPMAGCFIHGSGPPPRHRSRPARYAPAQPTHAPAARTCRPSHYWDGSMCRHKGKGHGARKHDY